MRHIEFGLLNKELADLGLPIAGLSGPVEVSGAERATFVPYHSKYLKVTWRSEPTKEHLVKLVDRIASHLGSDVALSALTEQVGAYVETSQGSEPKDIFHEFEQKISDSVIPLLDAFISSGIRLQKIGVGGASIDIVSGGSDEAKRNLTDHLRSDPALVDIDALGIIHQCGGSGSSLTVAQITEWLIERCMRTNAQTALEQVNNYLLDPIREVDDVHCIVGVQVESDCELLPGIRIITRASLSSYKSYKRIFDPFGGPQNPRRTPTAALISTTSAPKFRFSDSFWPRPDSEHDLNTAILLLTLFGPSATQHFLSFSEAKDDFDSKGVSWNGSEIEGAHNTINLDDLAGFKDLYEAAVRIDGKPKARITNSLSRLRKSMSKRSLAEKALELGIALECILLAGGDEDGSSGEITYRLASRGAWLLGENFEERKRIFSVLKAAYRQRSKVVHEGKVPTMTKRVFKGEGPMPTSYLIQDAATICSDAIRKLVLLGSIPDWTDLILGE